MQAMGTIMHLHTIVVKREGIDWGSDGQDFLRHDMIECAPARIIRDEESTASECPLPSARPQSINRWPESAVVRKYKKNAIKIYVY